MNPATAALVIIASLLSGPARGDTAPSSGRLRLLPAWETEQEKRRVLLKDSVDQLNTFRLSHPEMYGATEPPSPSLQIRLPAEFEPVGDVYYVWWVGGLDSTYLASAITIGASTGLTAWLAANTLTHRAILSA